jgi:hypothetical protein
VSLPGEEAHALAEAFALLCDLSSGAEKRIPSAARERARGILKHYPLAAEQRWLEETRRTASAPKPQHTEMTKDEVRGLVARFEAAHPGYGAHNYPDAFRDEHGELRETEEFEEVRLWYSSLEPG